MSLRLVSKSRRGVPQSEREADVQAARPANVHRTQLAMSFRGRWQPQSGRDDTLAFEPWLASPGPSSAKVLES